MDTVPALCRPACVHTHNISLFLLGSPHFLCIRRSLAANTLKEIISRDDNAQKQ